MTAVAEDVQHARAARARLPFLAGVERAPGRAARPTTPVGRASRETLAAGGKRLRPLLVC